MLPITFKEQNKTLTGPPGSDIQDLAVFNEGGVSVSCWRPSLRERLSILLFGRVWLLVQAGTSQPPVAIVGEKDFPE